MIHDNNAGTPVPGLFESLARQQLAPAALRVGALRPQRPYWSDAPPGFVTPEDEFLETGMSPARRTTTSANTEASDAPTILRKRAPAQPAPDTQSRVHHTSAAPPSARPPAEPSSFAMAAPTPSEREVLLPPQPPAPAPRPQAAAPNIGTAATRSRTIEGIISAHRIEARTRPPLAPAPRREPLQPSVRSPLAARPNPIAPLRAAVESTTSEPIIEIHIGRLEVRAPAAPRPEMARPQASPPDRRLASYLRGRGNGARS